jgi:DNA-binding response OmpR family regulator
MGRVSEQTILVVDDEEAIAEAVRARLESEGYRVVAAADGPDAIAAHAEHHPDLVVLDLMLPGMDGLEVCKRIRERSRVPVIMLTAKGDETDRVVGLELGADDYVPKPFSPRELLARLRAVLRRSSPEAVDASLVVGDIAVEVTSRQVRVGGNPVDLTGIEFDILLALARRPGRVVPRDTLLSQAGRDDVSVGDRTVDVHVSHLRRKLGDDPRSPKLIKTVRGVGYVLTKESTG